MASVRIFGLLVLAALGNAFAAGASDDADSWSAVQTLRKGDRIGVIQSDLKRVEGRFDSATAERITLQADREITLEKTAVLRVYRPARRGRVFGLVVGGLVGVAAGAVVDGTLGHYFRNETGGPEGGVITAVGGAAGAGIGAAVTGWPRTVYQRPK